MHLDLKVWLLLMKKFGKFIHLDTSDKIELMRLWIALLSADFRLRLLPHKLNKNWLFNSEIKKDTGNRCDKSRSIDRITGLTAIAASHHILTMTCLRRSLVLRDRLRDMNLEADIKFGVRKNNSGADRAGDKINGIDAHCWVECNGRVLDTYGTSDNFFGFK